MASLVIWMAAFTIGTCVTVLSAATGSYGLHLGVTGLVTLSIAIVAVQEHGQLMAHNAKRSALAATTSRYIGLVWIWAACAILVTYEFILSWRETWQFVIGLAIIGALCLGLAIMFDRDAESGKEDPTMLSLGRTLNLLQMVGMLMAVIGLVADNKFILTARGAVRSDWAANNIFFFGAIAVALIGAHALISEKKLEQARS
jgi:hypothetical protein